MLCRKTNLFSIRTWLATDFSQNKNKLILDMRDARLFQRYESPALCLQLSLTLSWLRLNEDKCSLLACGSREKKSKLDLNYHHLPNARFFFLTVYILLHLHWVSLCIYSVTSCFTCRWIICKHRRPPLLTADSLASVPGIFKWADSWRHHVCFSHSCWPHVWVSGSFTL